MRGRRRRQARRLASGFCLLQVSAGFKNTVGTPRSKQNLFKRFIAPGANKW